MKKIILFITLSTLLQTAIASETKVKALSKKPTEQNLVKKEFNFSGTKYTLKDEKKSPQSYLAEYLPEGENFDQFNQMFAIWGSKDSTKLTDQVKAKVQFVTSRKASDPLANYKLFVGEDKKSYGLDFVISEGNIIEHNVWYFTENKNGKIMYQYARRNYMDSSRSPASAFIKEIREILESCGRLEKRNIAA